MASKSGSRVVAYDLLRIVAALAVVSIHVLAAHLSGRTAVPSRDVALAASNALHFAVPLFTFLSGALSWGAVWRGGPGEYVRYVGKRLSTVGLPYLAWALFYFLLRPLSGQGGWGSIAGALRDFAVLFVSGNIWYHLYYLPMILVLYLFTPLASAFVRRAPEPFLAAMLAVRVLAAEPIMAVVIRMPLHGAFQPLAVNVIRFLPYMALGAWFAVRRERISSLLSVASIPLLAGGLALSLAATFGRYAPSARYESRIVDVATMSALVLGLAGLAFAFGALRTLSGSGRLARRVTALASLTFGVYLVHPIVIFGTRKLMGALSIGQAWDSAAFVGGFGVFAIAASFALAAVLKRGKWTARLV